jgi:hypothetical protein
MSTHINKADLMCETANPIDAFAPMSEETIQEFRQTLETGCEPVAQAEAPPGKVFVLDRKYSHSEVTLRACIRALSEAEFEGCEGEIVIYADGEVQTNDLEREMRIVAAKQLATYPDGDGPPLVEQVIRAAYQDENPPKKALKEILLAAQKPASMIIKDMLANARVLDQAELAHCEWIDVAPSEFRGPFIIVSPQIAQRQPEWAAAVLDGLDILECDCPELAFFYRLAVLTGATARDLADLFDTPLVLVLDEMDQAHAMLLRIIRERARVGIPS